MECGRGLVRQGRAAALSLPANYVANVRPYKPPKKPKPKKKSPKPKKKKLGPKKQKQSEIDKILDDPEVAEKRKKMPATVICAKHRKMPKKKVGWLV